MRQVRWKNVTVKLKLIIATALKNTFFGATEVIKFDQINMNDQKWNVGTSF